MKAFGVLLVALAAHPVGGIKVGTHGSNMMRRILGMLQTMSDDLHREGKEATHQWALTKCECDETKESLANTISAKAKAIAASEADKESAQASANKASQQVADSKAAIKKATKDMADATSNRNKEKQAYDTEKGELEALMATLDNAIASLANSVAFIQSSNAGGHGKWLDATRQMLNDVMPMMSESQAATTQSFLQQPNKQMVEQVSMTLQGLKKQFNAQLEDATDQENAAQASYDNWTTETTNMKNMNENLLQSAQKTLSSTDARVDAADEVIDHEGLQALKDELTQKTTDCDFQARRYNEHSALRADEAAAVQEGLSILGSDDSKDLFNALDDHSDRKTPALLQISSFIRRIRVAAPQDRNQGEGAGKLDKVIKSIENQKQELNQTNFDDKAWAQECSTLMAQLDEDLKTTEDTQDEKTGELSDKEQALVNAKTLAEELANHAADVRNSMKKTNETYNQTTEEFNAAVRDQTAALALLNKVVEALNKFYAEATRTEHKSTEEGKDFEQHKSGNTVLKLLETLQGDISKGMKTEQDDQVEATSLFEESMEDMGADLSKTTDRSTATAANMAELEADIKFLKNMLQELSDQHAMLTQKVEDNTPRCNFIDQNLQARLDKRGVEMDGLTSAQKALKGVQAA